MPFNACFEHDYRIMTAFRFGVQHNQLRRRHAKAANKNPLNSQRVEGSGTAAEFRALLLAVAPKVFFPPLGCTPLEISTT